MVDYQYYFMESNFEKITDVKPSCFKPSPKVMSSIIMLTPKKSI